MLKKMCVIKARWTFQKSKMMGYIPVQRITDWAMIVQIPALVSPFISCVPAFWAQKVFASVKIDTIFPSHWWENYSITLSKYCELTRLVFFWRNFIIIEGTDGLKPGVELLIVTNVFWASFVALHCLNFIWPKFSKLHFWRFGFRFFFLWEGKGWLGVGVLHLEPLVYDHLA